VIGPASTLAYVALGSNLGDRVGHLAAGRRALEATSGVHAVRASRLYETDPVGPPPQGPYLNAVLELTTDLSPEALLARLLAIESERGRTRGPQRDLPRTLDLDLLLFGTRRLRRPDLEIPHPRLHERAFVLVPLCDLAPELRHPRIGATMAELLRRLPSRAGVRTFDSENESKRREDSRWRSWP
jgi:2-amino-4-hydroxy-6-hydroxymethyldihydropteridine diphosphokinase